MRWSVLPIVSRSARGATPQPVVLPTVSEVPVAPRQRLHPVLRAVDEEICGLILGVTDGLQTATTALVAGAADHAPPAKAFARGAPGDRHPVSLIEAQLEIFFARQSPVASDMRFALTAIRVAPQLGRCHNLTTHIERRAALGARVPTEVVEVFEAVGTQTSYMWEAVYQAWTARDVTAATTIDQLDDPVDVAVGRLSGLLAGSLVEPAVAMEAAVVGRFYERLGDHAVHVAQRVEWMAGQS
jgi:phosphate transport system protein